MKMKKYLACLMAAMMMAGAAVACGNQTAPAESSVAETEATTEATTAEAEETTEETTEEAETTEAEDDEDGQEVQSGDAEFEEAHDAQPGQAYLAIVDGQWWVQYWGSSTKDGYMLSYDAGIADIQGDGTYTVSVTADTNGFRYDTTGDVNGEYTPEGLSFLAVMIPDGEELYPESVITIDSIKVDGNEIEMSAKNYTSSDDGKETRTNIFNSWVDKPSEDGRSIDGNLYDADGNAADFCADYSAQIVNPDDFKQWTTVEVTFTITNTGSAGTAHAGDADADADANADATDADADTTDADADTTDADAE